MKITQIWKNYNKELEGLFEDLSNNFKGRRDPIFLELENGKKVKIRKNNLLTNIILWYPFYKVDSTKFNEGFILDLQKNHITNDLLFDYFDKLIELFQDDDLDELNLSLAETIALLDRVSRRFNPRIGNSISLHSLIQLEKDVSEVSDFFHFHLDENKQSNENEQIIEEATKRLVALMKANENCIQDFLNCGEGINIGQMSQMVITSGYKSNLAGKVYPVPINTNLLRGFRNISDYVLDATAGRKSMVITYNQVKRSGYMTRKLSLLCIDTVLADVEDCGTTAYMHTFIRDKGTLNKLKNRYYVDEKGKLKLITSNSEELIGKTINLRSPMTCKCKDKICHTCYGKLANLNKDIHIGLFATQLLTAQLTQMLLSSKHLLKTNSEKIEMSEEFNKFFQLSGNLIYKNEDFQYLVINEDDLIEEEDEDIQEDDATADLGKIGIHKFRVCNKKLATLAEFEESKTLYLSEELIAALANAKREEGEYLINLKNWNFEDILFYIDIQNKELSSTLDKVIKLIDSKEHLGITNHHDLLNRFLELIPEANLKPDSVHIEIILRELIRSSKNKTMRPDFEANEEYVILRASEAILHSSLAVSLSFEHFKRQVTDVTTYSKDKKSFLEPMFN